MDIDVASFLRQQAVFSDLPEDALQRLAAAVKPVTFEAGEVLMNQGEDPDSMYIVVDGEFEISTRTNEEEVLLNLCGQGEPLGEMSMLSGRPRTATVRATRPSNLLSISQDAFRDLMGNPEAALALLRTAMRRIDNQEAQVAQHAKMAALGTLTAGLLHELNNPAAAVRRGSSHLRELLLGWQQLGAELDRECEATARGEAVERLRDEVAKRSADPPALDPLMRSDREEALAEWLEDQGIENGWDLAAPLVTLGWDDGQMEEATREFSADLAPIVVRWLASTSELFSLLTEVANGAERISEIVGAVKSYARVDEAPIQDVTVTEGLESTLTILRHKLGSGVKVIRDYDPSLPEIDAFPSELNQVWTNLIDNAVDAMDAEGELTLRTRTDDQGVIVEVIDSGPGIPEDVQRRIFDPFFTTKPPGQGTGLGLATSYSIITNRHRGRLTFTSQPGETRFQVWLPKRLHDRTGPGADSAGGDDAR